MIILIDAEKTSSRIHHRFLIKTKQYLPAETTTKLCKLVLEGNLFNLIKTVYAQ